MSQRCFLFLQGPHGPFFKELGQGLKDHGHRVLRINLNGGDRYFWSGEDAIDFQEPPTHWPGFVRGVMERYRVTDLLVYGDCRPLHQQAIRIARGVGIQVYVFEEGYLRPNWITMEESGVNGYSRLARDPEVIRRMAGSQPEPEHELSVGPQQGPIKRLAFWYTLMMVMDRRNFPYYRTHRQAGPWMELSGWVKRHASSIWRGPWSAAQEWRLIRGGKPFYLVPLQLNGDYQVRVHSRFGRLEPFIDEVMASFRVHAPRNTLLVFKNHPLDNGLVDLRQMITAKAERLGIRHRVVFIDGGKLAALANAALGAITINSTSGMTTLLHNRPTIALGDAIYNVSGLTFDGPLDRFWTEAMPPDPELFRAFRRYLCNLAQVNGSFFTAEARQAALQVVLARILGQPVNEPASQPVLGGSVPATGLEPARSAAKVGGGSPYWRTHD